MLGEVVSSSEALNAFPLASRSGTVLVFDIVARLDMSCDIGLAAEEFSRLTVLILTLFMYTIDPIICDNPIQRVSEVFSRHMLKSSLVEITRGRVLRTSTTWPHRGRQVQLSTHFAESVVLSR